MTGSLYASCQGNYELDSVDSSGSPVYLKKCYKPDKYIRSMGGVWYCAPFKAGGYFVAGPRGDKPLGKWGENSFAKAYGKLLNNIV